MPVDVADFVSRIEALRTEARGSILHLSTYAAPS